MNMHTAVVLIQLIIMSNTPVYACIRRSHKINIPLGRQFKS